MGHLDAMSEDYQRRFQRKIHVQQMVLIHIRNMLQSMGKDIKTYPLPDIIDRYDDANGADREIYEEKSIEPTIEDVALKDSLNQECWGHNPRSPSEAPLRFDLNVYLTKPTKLVFQDHSPRLRREAKVRSLKCRPGDEGKRTKPKAKAKVRSLKRRLGDKGDGPESKAKAQR